MKKISLESAMNNTHELFMKKLPNIKYLNKLFRDYTILDINTLYIAHHSSLFNTFELIL